MGNQPAYIGFPQIVRATMGHDRLTWKSRLSAEPIAFNVNPSERVIRLVNEAADSRSAIARHLRKLFPKHGPAVPGLWGKYLESYDTLTAFADDHRDLLERVDVELPRGHVRLLAMGAGLKNFSLFLGMRSPERSFTPVADAGWESMDGGILNHVLCHVADKRAALTKAFEALRYGGTLVLTEPVPKVRSTEKMKGFLIQLAASAVENHSPMTDYDLALVSYVSLHRLARVRGGFIGPAALEQLCREVGFYVEKSESIHSGFARMLVLRK